LSAAMMEHHFDRSLRCDDWRRLAAEAHVGHCACNGWR
jgi:hypothetical protein